MLLSNDAVARRIDDIAEDVQQQLFGKLGEKLFSLQLDEATDSNKDAHFVAYVRFCDGLSEIILIEKKHPQTWFCKPSDGKPHVYNRFCKTSDGKPHVYNRFYKPSDIHTRDDAAKGDWGLGDPVVKYDVEESSSITF
ncbi:hypothetical protein X975_03192, partial [Stegodyphus mimosarum]